MAVLTDTGGVRHRSDIPSPRFLRDGTALTWPSDVAADMTWERTNSPIYGLYAHDDVIATVHGNQTRDTVHRRTPHSSRPGNATFTTRS
ncbi:MAG: hypothetical protein OXQ29_16645 [Rhodospirillaceae bacterium]|nr:hypothetical protein [Rhodospirillaceae bacterium]